MDRVGIITIVDERNYGNRLQNYALQRALESLGVPCVETIRNAPHRENPVLLAQRAAIALAKAPRTTVSRNIRRMEDRRDEQAVAPVSGPAAAEPHCDEFTRNRIREYPVHFDAIAHKREFAAEFDAFVVGSDQVWNPGFRKANGIDFLTFARRNQRIVYAASFGMPAVPTYLRRLYQRRLRGIPSISVREASGARIVAELTGRDVPVVLDPTLVVDPQRWTELALTPAELSGREYALSFFLGGFRDGEREWLERRALSDGLELVDYRSTPVLAGTGPEEFLGALREAAVVVTDSFHAAALSLALQTPFRVRFRHDGDTRMDTLFGMLGARTDGDEGPLIPRPDWDAVQERTARERAHSLGWLSTSLGSVQES